MILPQHAYVLQNKQAANWSEFVNFWEKAFNYSSTNESYEMYVLNRPELFIFDEHQIQMLYKWKNNTGETLSSKKNASLERNILAHLPIVQQLTHTWDNEVFDNSFGKISTIWQIFLMHIIQPNRFPIFDQHVYRAYSLLKNGSANELKGTIKRQLALYRDYQSFFDEIQYTSKLSPRSIDKAFWAFGKFIKLYPIFVRLI